MAQVQQSILPADYKWPMHGGRVIGRILKENGIKYVFGVMGGHQYALEPGFYEHGIKRIHVRHEQAGAYAADAYARCTRTPGICYATAGPGMTNAVSGINQAFLARSPVVALFGQHPRVQSLLDPFQEGYPAEVCQTMAKWTKFVEEGRLIPMYLRKALRDSMIYPPGPVVLAWDPQTLEPALEEKALFWDTPNSQKSKPLPTLADPQGVEEAVRMLIQAEKPVIVAGDGVYWADAASELQKLVEFLQIPTNTRRLGRGSVPEDHGLAIHS
ncbi:MAG: thiamine pyrophosphate-binding protein, partial [Chloroflexota bacterium]|nr:thiamine pyrophosphate-binding protein [Chloroflexota bacterium]